MRLQKKLVCGYRKKGAFLLYLYGYWALETPPTAPLVPVLVAMNLELIAYPFLFAAIFFEVFLLLTFLSPPARAARARSSSKATPSVAIVVPCFNESRTVGGTARSLLALAYPKDKLRIVLVNDGSTDDTEAVMQSFAHEPQVTVLTQKNGGKHTALNAGIAVAKDAEIIGCLDADSFVTPTALTEALPYFDRPNVGAVTAAMSVHAPRTFIEHMQNAEYVLGIALRHILAAVNGIHVTPGPFSLYRRSVIEELGGFRHGHNTEDMEMALRIQRAGLVIDSAPRAKVYTTTPRSVPALVKQRTRWTTGFLRNVLNEYRDLIGNPRYGALGVIVLPLGFFAIVGGMVMAFFVLYTLTQNAITAYNTTNGVPLSYTLGELVPGAHTLQWFYFPITLFILLAVVAGVGCVLFILLGRKISGTDSKLSVGIVGYLLAYGFIAPFWLVRSVADVASGTMRSWR